MLRSTADKLCLFAMLCGFLSSTAPTAIAEDGRVLHAASSNRDLWIAKALPESETLIILHRRAGDEPNQVQIVSSGFRGPLAPGGFTAGQDRLWLIHAERPIYSVRPPPTAADAMWQPRHPSIAGNLPRQVELRVSGAGPRRLWTLVRVSDAAGLDSIAALEVGAVMERRRSVATNPAAVTEAAPTSTDEPKPVPADVESTPADAETLDHTIAQFAAKWKVRGAERVVLGFLSRADTSVKALPMSICPHPK